MKKNIISYIAIFATAALAFASCGKDKADVGAEGKGKLTFDMTFGGGDATRSAVEAPDGILIRIVRNDISAVVYKFTDPEDERLKDLWLSTGQYTIIVEGGVSDIYSFDGPFYKGTEVFSIAANEVTPVSVKCTIQNALFKVAFDNSVKDFFSQYGASLFPVADNADVKMTFDNTDEVGENGFTVKTAYLMLGKSQTSIDWKFEGVHTDYGSLSKEGSIINLESGKRYNLTIRYTPAKGELGLGFSIMIDDTLDEQSHNIGIFQRPRISPVGGWLFSDTHQQGDRDEYEMGITASSDIASITLSGSVFGDTGVNVLAEDFSMGGVEVDKVNGAYYGLTFTYELFREMFLELNEVTITVVDSKSKSNDTVFKINITEISGPIGSLTPFAAGDTNIWAKHAYVRGTISGHDDTTEAKLAYRLAETEDAWLYADAVIDADGKIAGTVVGLASSSTYQVTLVLNGKRMGSGITFTTDIVLQPENAGFEGWNDNGGKVTWYPYAQGGSKYWDTANDGLKLATTSETKNPTMWVEDKRPGSAGTKSAKMNSRYVTIDAFIYKVSKFAAGNLFSGSFAGVSTSPQGGKVDFGRPFTARPSALKGWYKGFSGVVDKVESNPHINVGDTDQYQIYVCLTTWDGVHRLETWRTETFIDFNKDDIIAYGEMSSSEHVENWTEFSIPITYKRTDIRPTYILMVCCSSKYGDYLSGSTSSWLQVDDFELIYDENIVTK